MKNLKERNDERRRRAENQHKIAALTEKLVDRKEFQAILNPSWWSKLWR